MQQAMKLSRPMEDAASQPQSRSTTASDSEVDNSQACSSEGSSRTLSGATGKFLAEELSKWMKVHRPRKHSGAQNAWEHLELGVKTYYDRPFGIFFNFIYDILQLSSGRDKLCALMQGYAKFASAVLSEPNSERHWMYRGVEDSLSDGRKFFRLFKEFREVYKVRRGFHRLQEGIAGTGLKSVPSVCGCLDICAHVSAFFFCLFDNLLWAASIGIVRSKEVPKLQRKMWQGFRSNGPVLRALGGVASVKRKKNYASIWRLVFAMVANGLLLHKAIEQCWTTGGGFQGPDDPRLFHTLELVGMAASFRILFSKLGYSQISHSRSGLLSMLAAACGIWSNWRKVRRKNFGTKTFITTVERRKTISG